MATYTARDSAPMRMRLAASIAFLAVRVLYYGHFNKAGSFEEPPYFLSSRLARKDLAVCAKIARVARNDRTG